MNDPSFNFMQDTNTGSLINILQDQILQTESYNIISYSVYSVTIELFTSCTIHLLLNTDKGTQISKAYKMTTEQYLNWTNNDFYIINLVNENLMQIIDS